MHDENEKHRLLIVDDTPSNVDVLYGALKEKYRISVALNGRTALKLAHGPARPDMILLDIMMPGMDGYEVLKKLKADEETWDIPVIFITAMDQPVDEQMGFALGAVDYITKPFSPPVVLQRIENHINLKLFHDHLEELVQRRTRELRQTNAAYERFVPKELISYLNKPDIISVERGDAIPGEFTILFSDMRGFTALSEGHEPTEIMEFVNDYLNIVAPAVRAHDGFIVTYIGDAIMAAFPRAAEDAVDCAREMATGLARFNEERIAAGKRPIEIGIGINSGPATLGIIGEEKRLEGTVMSDVTNLAARLESLTKRYQTRVLFSNLTLLHVQDRQRFDRQYPYRQIDTVRVAGRKRPVTIYELLFEGDEKKIQQSEHYLRALDYYRRKNVRAARELLGRLKTENPEDHCLDLFMERCDALLDFDEEGRIVGTRLPADFDGITTLDRK